MEPSFAMIKAYKLAIRTTKAQERFFIRQCAQSRLVYNEYLRYKQAKYAERMAAKEAGVENWKEISVPSAMGSSKWLTDLKRGSEWLQEAIAQSLVGELSACDKAYKNFFRRIKAGGPPGFPKFKGRFDRDSFYLSNQSVKRTESGLRIMKIGEIRLFEKDYLPREGSIREGSISKQGGRWFVSLVVETQDKVSTANNGPVVGVDLGIRNLITISDGTVVQAPKPGNTAQKRQRRLAKSMSRKTKGSANYKKAKARLEKLHSRVANKRLDFTHKTTKMMTTKYGLIGMETLQVKNLMSKKGNLGRSLADVALGELNRQLDYKAGWYGSKILRADRFFPSSKICSVCSTKNSPGRTASWSCERCGVKHDRDENAAQNLLAWVSSTSVLPKPGVTLENTET